MAFYDYSYTANFYFYEYYNIYKIEILIMEKLTDKIIK